MICGNFSPRKARGSRIRRGGEYILSSTRLYWNNTPQLGILDNPPGFLYLHVEQFVLFLWPGVVGGSANYN
jgi:hypothetical protein